MTPPKKKPLPDKTDLSASDLLKQSFELCVGDFEGVEFEVGIYFKVFPDIITRENSGRRSVIPLESRR